MILVEDKKNPDSQSKLWEELGIHLPSETAARYFFGDRVSGYFEGYTHSYLQGSGYQIRDPGLNPTEPLQRLPSIFFLTPAGIP